MVSYHIFNLDDKNLLAEYIHNLKNKNYHMVYFYCQLINKFCLYLIK